jgi:signal transduction histidine kinase
MQTVTLQPTNVKDILSRVIEDFTPTISRQSIRLETVVEEELPTINLDEAQISRALKNVIMNSIEALPEAGTLKLKAHAVDSYIRITVEDFGVGIDEDKIDSVLDPFVTSKTTGAGLGLTMVYQIVMNHQGEIDIRSRGRKGTIVTLELPVNLQPDREE